jgi:hypothetical protein
MKVSKEKGAQYYAPFEQLLVMPVKNQLEKQAEFTIQTNPFKPTKTKRLYPLHCFPTMCPKPVF